MILLFDAGNTRLKWALADAAHNILQSGVVDYPQVADAIKALTVEYRFTTVAISSVAGEARNEQLAQLSDDLIGLTPLFAKVSHRDCGIKNDYHALDRLGVDRWVAAMGVASNTGTNRIIVDAGTAVTVDIVDANNVFLGGVILPGVRLMHDSLVGETAGIRSARDEVSSVIGKNTQQCVNSGAQYGLVGAVDRVVDEFILILDNDEPWHITLCGGDAAWLSELMKTSLPITKQPNLIFQGLLNLLKSGGLK